MKIDPITPSIIAVLVSGIALAMSTGACSRGTQTSPAAEMQRMVDAFDLSPRDWISRGEDGSWKRGHLEWGKPKMDFSQDGRSCGVSVIQLSYLYRTDDLQESFSTREAALAGTKLDPLMNTLSARYQWHKEGWVRVSGDDWHPFTPGKYQHAASDGSFEWLSPTPGETNGPHDAP